MQLNPHLSDMITSRNAKLPSLSKGLQQSPRRQLYGIVSNWNHRTLELQPALPPPCALLTQHDCRSAVSRSSTVSSRSRHPVPAVDRKCSLGGRRQWKVVAHDSDPNKGASSVDNNPRDRSSTLTQEQQQQQQQHSLNGNGHSNGNGSDDRQQRLTSEEQELKSISTIPVKEQRYEAIAAWVGAAMAFGGGIWYLQGPEKAQEYFAGYLLEQSLSVDNLFVFILVFNYFKTPIEAQGKVLTWGIASAAILRGIFILAGVELIDKFEPLLIVFAAILIFSSYKLLADQEDDDEEDLTDNAVVKFCRRFIPTTDTYEGDRFWSTTAPGVATPLLLTLAVVELSDVLFAVDSIPAVFGVTLDPFIIYTSNIFAILSLRALYGFVSNIMSELRFLDKAVAIVLGFIGVKMLLGFADVHIPTDVSLLTVGVLLGGGVAASLLLPATEEN